MLKNEGGLKVAAIRLTWVNLIFAIFSVFTASKSLDTAFTVSKYASCITVPDGTVDNRDVVAIEIDFGSNNL